MKRLRLTSITDLDFGVHRGRSIADLDHEFLCIFGPNESGKSTLAEYLQWMIGGPSGTAATAGRFTLADGGRDVGGRLLGTLDGDHLELMARFRIVQRGAPNDVRTGLLRGVDLDARAIARTLGELTPDDYAQLHRLRGAELGRGPEAESFSALFTQFAVGSAAASINPRTRLAELSAALRPASSRVTALARAERDLALVWRKGSGRSPEYEVLAKFLAPHLDPAAPRAGA